MTISIEDRALTLAHDHLAAQTEIAGFAFRLSAYKLGRAHVGHFDDVNDSWYGNNPP